jgi:PAS domain S-box-containing protein
MDDMAAPHASGGGATGDGPPAVAVVDADGIVTAWTQAAEDLLGHRATDILGRSGAILMPDDRAARTTAWADRLGDHEHWSGLVNARHRDGHAIPLLLKGSRLRTRDGTTRWLLSAMPVSARISSISVLEPLINLVPVALCVWDLDLRCVWINEAAQRLRHVFPHYQVGRSLAGPLAGADLTAAAETVRAVLADGVPVIDREFHWISADQRAEHTLSISLFRIEGVDGRSLGVCSLALDITHSRARQRLALLREASIRIGSTLDVKKTAQELADLAVPVLADYVTVDLAGTALPDDDEPLHRLTATESSIPVFRRAGMASIHDGFPEAIWERGEAVYVPPSSPFTKVLASGRSHFEPELDTSPGTWLDQDPDRARAIHTTGMHSLIIVPVSARGDILGITVFVRTDNLAPFTRDDLILAEELVARAALSLDNARRYTRERTAALALQRHLLPRSLSGGGAVEVASRYRPSDIHGVGGDWFDTIPLQGGRIALVVGDVTGHGINAAAMMGRVRTAVRTLAYLDLPPDQLLSHLDHMVAHLNEFDTDSDSDTDDVDRAMMAATCLYAVYDPATRMCTMARAGHPPPAVVHPAGDVAFLLPPTGTPIGLGLGAYDSLQVELAEGSLIALYTDGLIETRETDLDAGMDRLRVALAQARLPLEHFCSTVIDTMVKDDTTEDDVALLVARTNASRH